MSASLLGNPRNFGTCFCGRVFGDERVHAHAPVVLSSLAVTTPLAYQRPAATHQPGAASVLRPKRSSK